MCRLVPLLLLTLGLGCAPAPPAQPTYVGGIQVNEPDHATWAAAVDGAGLNTIAVTVYAMQGDWDTDHLWYDEQDTAVVSEIRAAKAQGLRVVFVARVALDHAFEANEFLWHGMIMPRSETQLDSWFAQYTAFLVHWAALCQAEGVDVFGVGSELNALASTAVADELPALESYYLDADKQAAERAILLAHADRVAAHHLTDHGARDYATLEPYLDARDAKWRAWARALVGPGDGVELLNARRLLLAQHWTETLAAVRAVYSGPLTYAANFDQYQQVGFWGELDLIGINAYFPLRELHDQRPGDPALQAELEQGWVRVFDEIQRFQRREKLRDRPVIFTELGYTDRANSTVHPWASAGFSLVGEGDARRPVFWLDQPPDEAERSMAFRALADVVARDRRNPLRGVLYWKLTTDPGHRDIEPFAVHVGPASADALLPELARLAGER
jgi:Glycoside Hydrolase Family 113